MRHVPEMSPRPQPVALLALATFVLGLALAGSVSDAGAQPSPPVPVAGAAAPAFGDSGWVAPLPEGSIEGEPTDPGPRVAEADHEPTGETVLRTPFRILFYPLRLVARGLEETAGFALPKVAPQNDFGLGGPPKGFYVLPTGSYDGAPGPAVGLVVGNRFDPAHSGAWSAGGTYSLFDTRKLYGSLRWGGPEDRLRFVLHGAYGLRPNESYNGIGNFSSKADKAIWLSENGTVDLTVRYGPPQHHVRFFSGWRTVSARRGWNGEPGVLDVFTLPEVPGMLAETQIVAYGPGADLALVDNLGSPTRGIHLRGDVGRFDAVSGGDFDYLRTQLEARAYVPVFSSRRVLAFRAVHHGINPEEGEVVPFYLLPDPTGPVHLAGYSAHRFLDNHLALANVEYRWLIWEERLWAFAVGEIAEVASSASRLRIADVHEAYGGGLRLDFQGSILRATLAKGSDGFLIWFALGRDY